MNERTWRKLTEDFTYHALTEQRNQQSENLDTCSVREIVEMMNQEDQKVPLAVAKSLPQISASIERIVEVMKKGGKLFYVGAGTSGRLGILDASECPPTFGVPSDLVNGIIAGGDAAIKTAIENAEDDEEAGKVDIAKSVTSNDVVVGITSSGRTPYVIGAIKEANRIGALTVGISCNPQSILSKIVQCPIEVYVGPEIITGSTRLKAGTAQKMILNMISTTVMIQLGKVYRNLMVNVQATNEKLRKRVIRIIKDATGVDEQIAVQYAEKANGDARAAILMIIYGIRYEDSVQVLNEVNGHFPNAILYADQKFK
jgi:N-acetylmuramic acid 6-phosphate etherase